MCFVIHDSHAKDKHQSKSYSEAELKKTGFDTGFHFFLFPFYFYLTA